MRSNPAFVILHGPRSMGNFFHHKTYNCTVTSNPEPLPLRRIFRTWWPLAASWVLMGAELPALAAVVARLAEPEINLAAYGGGGLPPPLLLAPPLILLPAPSPPRRK